MVALLIIWHRRLALLFKTPTKRTDKTLQVHMGTIAQVIHGSPLTSYYYIVQCFVLHFVHSPYGELWYEIPLNYYCWECWIISPPTPLDNIYSVCVCFKEKKNCFYSWTNKHLKKDKDLVDYLKKKVISIREKKDDQKTEK